MPEIFHDARSRSQGISRSFYQDLRARDDDPDLEDGRSHLIDEDNLRRPLGSLAANVTPSQLGESSSGRAFHGKRLESPRWADDDDADNDVPASLLMEHNDGEPSTIPTHNDRPTDQFSPTTTRKPQPQLDSVRKQQRLYEDDLPRRRTATRPAPVRHIGPSDGRERALWRWVNTSNLDSFMRDVYDYYEGGGIWCILCSNALWLL